MSRFDPGVYIFHPVNAPDGVNIGIGNLVAVPPPLPLPVRAVKDTEIWLVTASANDTFNITAADTDRGYNYGWIQKRNALYALRDDVTPPTDFAITSAGNDEVWTIQIPNEDSLLTSKGGFSQLVFRPRDDTPAQHYQAIRQRKEE